MAASIFRADSDDADTRALVAAFDRGDAPRAIARAHAPTLRTLRERDGDAALRKALCTWAMTPDEREWYAAARGAKLDEASAQARAALVDRARHRANRVWRALDGVHAEAAAAAALPPPPTRPPARVGRQRQPARVVEVDDEGDDEENAAVPAPPFKRAATAARADPVPVPAAAAAGAGDGSDALRALRLDANDEEDDVAASASASASVSSHDSEQSSAALMVRLQGKRLDAAAAELAMLRAEHEAQTKKYNAVKARVTAAEAGRAAAEERAARTETERSVAVEELLEVEARLEATEARLQTALGEASELRDAVAAAEKDRERLVDMIVALQLDAKRAAAAAAAAASAADSKK